MPFNYIQYVFLVFIRDPLERTRKQYRVLMTVLQRKVMNLKPAQNTLDKRIKGNLPDT